MAKKLTQEEFIEKSLLIHGDKYDYSLTKHKKMHSKIKIICSIHGVFEQFSNDHIRGAGCKLCSQAKNKMTEDLFWKTVSAKHGDYYNYDTVKFNNLSDDLVITCPIHGKFTQKARNHYKGYGCFECNIGLKINNENFINTSSNLHNSFYDYSKVKIDKQKPVEIICPLHGSFLQVPHNHLTGRGCYTCGKERQGWNLARWTKACKNKNGCLYIIAFNYENNNLIKIGRTSSIKKRITNIKNKLLINSITISSVIFYEDTPLNIFNLENKLKRQFKKHNYKFKDIKFKGHTEVFYEKILKHINTSNYKNYEISRDSKSRKKKY